MILRSLLCTLALCFLPSALCYSQQFALDYRAGTTGIFSQKTFATGTNRLLGTLNGSDPVAITLGTGLSLSGSTLNATASGGTWGTITGTLSSQADLQAALDAKAATSALAAYLTTAAAATSYQPLNSRLTSIGGLANAPGVLTNNGSGLFTYTVTSTGGSDAEAGRIPIYGVNSDLRAQRFFALTNNANPSSQYDAGYLIFTQDTGSLVLQPATLTQPGRTLTLPDVSGTLITTGDTGSVTNTMLAGSIANAKLANSSITINGSAISLGGSVTTAVLSSNTFSGAQSINLTGLGTTPSQGLTLANTTAAALGAQQVSPWLSLVGQGWNSTSNASHPVEWAAHVLPVQGNPATSQLVVRHRVNNGSWVNSMVLNSPNDGSGVAATFFTQFGSCPINVGGGNSTYIPFLSATGWGSFQISVGGGTPSTLVTEGNDQLQLGVDSASPASVRFKGPDGSGTNIAGGSMTLAGGRSTGTGAGGDFVLQSSMSGTTGSGLNTLQERGRVIARFRDLTESTATNLVSIALASGRVVGGTATVTVWASDGTDHQALTSQVRVDAVNKAGTITVQVTQTDNTAAVSAGTLTVTYDAVQSGNAILLRANAVSSLTQTTLRARIVITGLNGDDVQTVTPQ